MGGADAGRFLADPEGAVFAIVAPAAGDSPDYWPLPAMNLEFLHA